jgi:hypothetical protein
MIIIIIKKIKKKNLGGSSRFWIHDHVGFMMETYELLLQKRHDNHAIMREWKRE